MTHPKDGSEVGTGSWTHLHPLPFLLVSPLEVLLQEERGSLEEQPQGAVPPSSGVSHRPLCAS